MKLKDIFSPVLFIILGIAFLAVSLWVILSRNQSSRGIKYKYKLGGLILSLSFFVSSCNKFSGTTCYDTPAPDNSFFTEYNLSDPELSEGDTIFFSIISPTYDYYSYQLWDGKEERLLNEGKMDFSKEKIRYSVPFNFHTDYNGECYLRIFGRKEGEDKPQFLHVEKIEFYGTKS